MHAERFERDYGCTETEWLRWLPGAVRDQPLHRPAANQAVVDFPQGHLRLDWAVLPPRRIGLAAFPRLLVRFHFDGVPGNVSEPFLRYFDLYTQRGGG